MSYQRYGIPTMGFRLFADRRFSPQQIPDLNGKIVVITGGTSGLGLESAIQMAAKNATVHILGSSETRGKQAIETIREKTGKTVVWHQLDLSSIKTARSAGEALAATLPSIDILLLNAGVASARPVPSVDGYEHIFALNHLGHFAFVQPLMNHFTATDVRIVVLTSAGHYNSPAIDYNALTPAADKTTSAEFRGNFNTSMQRYMVSKLANLLFARALQRRVGPNVYVNSVHPGTIATNIVELSKQDFAGYGIFAGIITTIFEFVFVYLGLNVTDGAMTQLYCCTSPDIARKNHKGAYFVPIAVQDTSSKLAEDEEAQEKLWKWSEDAVAKAPR